MGGSREDEKAWDVLWSGSKTTRETAQDCWAKSNSCEVREHKYQVTSVNCEILSGNGQLLGRAWSTPMVADIQGWHFGRYLMTTERGDEKRRGKGIERDGP